VTDDVFSLPPASCATPPNPYHTGFFYQLLKPTTPTTAPEQFVHQFSVGNHVTVENLDGDDTSVRIF
jgi:hypothetical protein